jgi:hypothetical protein
MDSTLGNSDMSMFRDLRTPRYVRFRRKCLFLLEIAHHPLNIQQFSISILTPLQI